MRALVPVLFLCAFAGGCGRPETAADRHFAKLRDGASATAAEQDRVGSLALADDNDDHGWATVAPPPAASTLASPAPAAPLRTIQIGADDDSGDNDDPNDPTARPEIRLSGPPGAASRSPRKSHGEIRIEPSSTDDATRGDTSRAPILDPDAKQAYDHARSLVTGKQYDKALEELTAFMTRFPDHPYVENALYWRGEVYFVRGEHQRAAEQFEAVVARSGNKAPDALYKLGMCQERLGAADRAKEIWARLRRDYPRSDAAKKLPSSGTKESR